MQVNPVEIAYKRKVGRIGQTPVIEVGLRGGLHLIFASRDGRFETIGAGPHRAVARHIAKRREDKIEWLDLSKADHVEPRLFSFCLPKYEALTDALRERQGL